MKLKYSRLLMLFSLIVLTTQFTYSQTEVERIAWAMNCWADPYDVVVQGDYAYLATGNSGLQVVDISDPEDPRSVGYCLVPDNAIALAVSGDIAYVACGVLAVIDISNPTDPRPICNIRGSYAGESLKIFGNIGFFNTAIVDLSDPEDPHTLCYLPEVGNPEDVTMVGEYLYVADAYFGLRIIDISDPTDPVCIGEYADDNHPEAVEIYDNYAFVGIGPRGLRILDISNPEEPRQIRLVDINAWDLEIRGEVLYVGGRDGLYSLDISNPARPEQLSHAHYSAVKISLQDSIACVSGRWNDGLNVIDISEPERLRELSYFTQEDGSKTVDVVGQYAYTSSARKGMHIMDISNPHEPQIAGFFEDPQAHRKVRIRDEFAYLTTWHSGLKIINIADPDSIFEAGRVIIRYSYGLNLQDTLAFITIDGGDNYYGIHIIDISDPENPEDIYTADIRYNCMVASGNILFASEVEWGSYGLRILDISDPSSPELIGDYQTPSFIEDIALSDNLCFLAVGERGVGILDITDPTEPHAVGFFNTPGLANKIRIEGDHLYISDYINDHVNSLLVMDVSDPAQPREVGYTNLPREIWDFTVSDGIAYLAELYMLEIYDCRPVISSVDNNFFLPENQTLIKAYPNPFNSETTIYFSLTAPGQVTLQVFDPLGRRIDRLISSQILPIGEHKSPWNPKGLASGNYLIRLNSDGNTTSQFITLVK